MDLAPASAPAVAAEDLGLGLMGLVPAEAEPLRLGLTPIFERRFGDFAAQKPDAGGTDGRIWNFVAAPGFFERTSSAGAWCSSTDRQGRVGALVLGLPGGAISPLHAWFGAAAQLLRAACDGYAPRRRLAARLAALPRPSRGGDPVGATFWIDDWEVHELYYATVHDLAARALGDMTGTRPEIAEDRGV